MSNHNTKQCVKVSASHIGEEKIKMVSMAGPSDRTCVECENNNLVATTLERLQSVDWDFPVAKTDYLTHRLHPYPAKFIPQIPRKLIEELSDPNETVADIFCGSGTTLVEALLAGRHAIGIDANPLACLVSQAKTSRLSGEDLDSLFALADRSRATAALIDIKREGLFYDPHPFVSEATRPSSEALSFWFDDFIVEELAEILAWCKAMPTDQSRTAALVAFSSIVVAVSKQDSDTRYVRREKQLSSGDAFR